MQLDKKTAAAFANSLTTVQLKLVASLFAEGESFDQAIDLLQEAESNENNLPEYLQEAKNLLGSPITGKKIAKKLGVSKDTVLTYIAKLRKRGFKIESNGGYGKVKYYLLE